MTISNLDTICQVVRDYLRRDPITKGCSGLGDTECLALIIAHLRCEPIPDLDVIIGNSNPVQQTEFLIGAVMIFAVAAQSGDILSCAEECYRYCTQRDAEFVLTAQRAAPDLLDYVLDAGAKGLLRHSLWRATMRCIPKSRFTNSNVFSHALQLLQSAGYIAIRQDHVYPTRKAENYKPNMALELGE